MNYKGLALALFLMGLSFADLVIPADQPVCRLYGMIQILGTVAGILVAAYAGFTLASSHELTERNTAKALLGGVVIGLIIVWIAPILVKSLVNSAGICGW
ncbi:TrbC/VIRB2 family protein [Candidatus Bilamarchaeum dharawalense]|uniref:TrbC/VIRB2 family protein n=1 Tax=Candidatus Bilamarchaeum dharawalense TaxID=2885759 RepID=A0A5E4LM54_9ARCH|nr:TrbC/VIRB2 family protein [Candidatus Bilamarchaeum dharawalense]